MVALPHQVHYRPSGPHSPHQRDLHKYLKAIDDNEQNFADDKFESEFDSFGAR